MTTEEAIRLLDPETRRETMRQIPVFERIDADQEACRMAVAALCAQQAPTKLYRSRRNGCFLCRDAKYLDGDVDVSGIYYVELLEFDFCPNCGRPLTEEAEAALKKREEADNETD